MNWLALDLNLLRVLDAMLRERNTTRVGERIGLSQPAVSSALNRLRQILADPLFVRQGNAMVPTPLAEGLEQPLQQALAQIERSLSGSASFDPAQSRRLFRMLGDDYLCEMLLPKLVERLARDAPAIRFQLLPVNPRPLAPQFTEANLDLAFGVDQQIPEWIERTLALHGSAVFVASKQNERLARAGVQDRGTIPLDLLGEMSHVHFAPEGSLVGREDQALASVGRRRRVVLTVPDFFSVARVAAQTQLIGALPTPFALSLAGQLGLCVYRSPVDVPVERLYLYWHKRHTGDAEHRWIRELVIELLEPLDSVRHPVAVETAEENPVRRSGGRRKGSNRVRRSR